MYAIILSSDDGDHGDRVQTCPPSLSCVQKVRTLWPLAKRALSKHFHCVIKAGLTLSWTNRGFRGVQEAYVGWGGAELGAGKGCGVIHTYPLGEHPSKLCFPMLIKLHTRNTFLKENTNVIEPQQQSAVAYRNLCNYTDANTSPYERKVRLSYHLLDEQ